MKRQEDQRAYNAAEISNAEKELIGPVERERLNNAPTWTRSLVVDLIRRIVNLRAALAAKDEALRGKEETWVRVEDDMPKRGHTVVVSLDGEKLAAIWNGEKWFMPCFRGSDWLPEKAMSGITHWMPLPPTPTPAHDWKTCSCRECNQRRIDEDYYGPAREYRADADPTSAEGK